MLTDLMRSDGSSRSRPNGFSLLECLVVVALVGILATMAIPSSSAVQTRLELESGLRRLRLGPDRGRIAAERDRQPCALQLNVSGWQPPLTGDLPACRGGVTPLAETGAGALQWRGLGLGNRLSLWSYQEEHRYRHFRQGQEQVVQPAEFHAHAHGCDPAVHHHHHRRKNRQDQCWNRSQLPPLVPERPYQRQ